ncbi:MAG: large conductance mechanosensitive channel protein MscL [Flavobacteriales bacterium CG_4_8_14_3_um_filter_35_10]|nr:large-conductance mechanosensitive channel protein MscL [Zetaproteobacteria bacterium]OIO13091.1 MAG: mechanosensitive ion channel protein MscL [Flavobacteriaceae bacterium CG1_02_35_72]PIX07266.1 MAG: large conductance mechanosensitive channel protein MscL [Flavobacteriales bacterium CG_4_8_14_3_um_filter_35_10]PJA06053.1 MAG: large conductance mechanosensitive channel protein MscL [Flavobacteriales bacterium CG_4_10_14_0_2_um_filter_35_18]
MSFIKDFKSFLLKGDIINLATAVIIGGAFGKVVSSLVKDVLMPPIGYLTGGVNFTDLTFVMKEAVKEGDTLLPAVTINYGSFLQTIIDFVIIGFCIFMVLKAYERTKKSEAPKPEAPKGPSTEQLLAEIRDLLAKK